MAVEIRPDKKKTKIISIWNAFAIIVFFTLILLIIDLTTTFLRVNFLAPTLLAVFIIAIVFFGLRYLLIISNYYIFQSENLVYKKTFFLIFKKKKKIEYLHLGDVKSEKPFFINQTLDIGTVRMDLSRRGEKDLKLKYISCPDETADKIKNLIRSYHVKEQRAYTEKYKMKDVL